MTHTGIRETWKIDLTPEKPTTVLSGKEPGVAARLRFDLDRIDQEPGTVLVIIPTPIVTSSFILGMFSKSMIALTYDGFFAKYQFYATESVIQNIRDNARFSVASGTALTS